MKKAIALVSLVTFLSACAVEREVRIIEVEKTTTTVASPVSSEDIYFDVIASNYPDVANRFGKQWIVDFGRMMCQSIDEGLTLEGLALMAIEANVEPAMVGYMTGAAIEAFCPYNNWFMSSLAGA